MNVTQREPSGTSASEGTEAKQVYTLVPVDRYGDSKDSCPPLTDKGIHYNYAYCTCWLCVSRSRLFPVGICTRTVNSEHNLGNLSFCTCSHYSTSDVVFFE